MFALSVATAFVTVDLIFFVYIYTSTIVSVFKLSVAAAPVSVHTMNLVNPIKNHFNTFALSVATETVSVCMSNITASRRLR